jgi:hypothetical protein
VNDSTRAFYEETVHRALVRHGVADPGAALCALLWLLRDRHQRDRSAFAARAYREGFELSDPSASTVAESLQNLAASAAHTAYGDGPAVVCDTESLASGMWVVGDVLAELIPLWDAEAMGEAAYSCRSASIGSSRAAR